MAQQQLIFALGSADLRGVLEEFLIERAADRECAPQTIRAYRLAVGLLARYLAEAGESLELPAIGPAQLRGFRLYLQRPTRWDGCGQRGRPLSDATRANYDRHLRTFFRWAARVGHRDDDPLADLPKPRQRRKPMRFLTEAELQALWASFPPKTRQGQRDRTLFLLLVDIGVRASEVIRIRLADVNLATGTVEIRGKGGPVRLVGMSPTTLQQIGVYVRRWRQPVDQPELLLHAVQRHPLSYWGLKEIFRRWRREAGLTEPFSAHSFRRTNATRSIQAGADGLVVAAQLGHCTLTMTKLYLQEAGLDLGQLRNEHSPLKGLKL